MVVKAGHSQIVHSDFNEFSYFDNRMLYMCVDWCVWMCMWSCDISSHMNKKMHCRMMWGNSDLVITIYLRRHSYTHVCQHGFLICASELSKFITLYYSLDLCNWHCFKCWLIYIVQVSLFVRGGGVLPSLCYKRTKISDFRVCEGCLGSFACLLSRNEVSSLGILYPKVSGPCSLTSV